MKKLSLICCVLLVSLSACKKDISSEEKVYSASNILTEWKEKGDTSPLYQEAHKDCMADLDTGLTSTSSKACMAQMIVETNKEHQKMLNSLIKTK